MIDLFNISFNGQKDYIINRIQSIDNRNHFYKACQEITYIIKECCTLEQLEIVLIQKRDMFTSYNFGFWIFSNPKRYYLTAFNAAIYITKSLNTRFIHGYTSNYVYNKNL